MRAVKEAGRWLGGIESDEFNDALRFVVAGVGSFDAS